jgi:hypothetical protein
MEYPIVKELTKQLDSYKGGNVELADGLLFSQYLTLKKIEYYSNSRYITGDIDELGRIKPFFNIVNDKVNVAVRATDIDTKDIEITADDVNGIVPALLFKKELQKWYKDSNFGVTLNDLSETRARYGGVLAKKSFNEDGELDIERVLWKNCITDQVDFNNGLVIERHFMTPDKLEEKRGVWDDEAIDEAIEFASKKITPVYTERYTSSTAQVCVYEIHGIFPESYLREGGSETTYLKQVAYVAYNGKTKNCVLFQDTEKELPYKYIAYRKVPGRTLGVGVVEDGFEAQTWTNDAIMKERNAFEIGSRVVFKSSTPNVLNNVLTDIDNGTIIDISQGGDITQLQTVSNAIPEFGNLVSRWSEQYQKVASVFDANTGENLPSGTPFRLAAIQNQEANSLFNYRREEMGLWLVEIFQDWVIPALTKKINREHILVSEYTPDELKLIDDSFATNAANKKAVAAVLNDKILTQQEYESFFAGAKQALQTSGSVRYIDVPKDYFKDFKYKITINITGEQRNKAVVLETLNSILTVVAQNPAILQDPALSQIFGKIVEYSGVGISPSVFMQGTPATATKVASEVTAPQGSPTALPAETGVTNG